MKNDHLLKDLHVGSIIKEEARKKNISSGQLADATFRDPKNAYKIFRLADMDVENVIRISYALQSNILDSVTRKYLSHLPFTANQLEQHGYHIKLCMKTKRFSDSHIAENCNLFLADIDIGKHIRKVAEENGWTVKSLAKELQCDPSMISYYYRKKSAKTKELILISMALQRNLIAEVYLCRMCIIPLNAIIDELSIIWNEPCVRIVQADDEKNPLLYRREIDKQALPPPYKNKY